MKELETPHKENEIQIIEERLAMFDSALKKATKESDPIYITLDKI